MAVRTTPAYAGQYDQRVTIQFDSATITDRDKNNAQREIWGDLFDTMANYAAQPSRPGGAEYNADNMRVVEDKALFRVRYDLQTITINPAKYRVIHLGKTWNIQRAYDPTGKRFEIHLECNAVV